MTGSATAPGAFLDRDGVINRDHGYVHSFDRFEFLPGAIDAMKALGDAGYRLVVVTNQSGIGRGYYTEEQFAELTREVTATLAAHGVMLAGTFHCPHAPASDGTNMCDCRKPQPGLIRRAADVLNIDLTRSLLFGDKQSDIAAGTAAGIPQCIKIASDTEPAGFSSLKAAVAARVAVGDRR